ncbi:hypothetical protein [Janthinobacterium sp. CG3]|uniref:hypothetical protein n=1 Tax=Janthinobacterium sp. CG3 TaxID=1075768 RepID=UPI00034B8C21|nr:hypothetical protein [Janthinobacterium sp. CG3]
MTKNSGAQLNPAAAGPLLATERQVGLLHHSLGINERRREPWRNHFGAGPDDHYRYVRPEHTRGCWKPRVAGDWKPTMKAAKASYKAALAANQAKRASWSAA